jgi:hypothetical protein
VALEAEKGFIACYQKVSVSCLGKGQQVIVVGIRGQVELRSVVNDDGQIANTIHQSTRERRGEPCANFGIPRRTRNFVQLIGGGQKIELTAAPEVE